MIGRTTVTRVVGLLMAICVNYYAHPRTVFSADDPSANWPKVLLKDIQDVAEDYVDQSDIVLAANSIVNPIDAAFNRILVYAIADAMTKGDVRLRTLDAHQYMGETASTAKQIGSSPSAGGSTSAIEKPDLIKLIGLAIDRGAIQKAVNGTSLTLSTSPYALAAFAQGDTAATYERYHALQRIGVSATYTITDQSQLLANLSRKQLDQFSIRLRLSPDRSTRSKDFLAAWDAQVYSKLQRRLVVLTREQAKLFVEDRKGDHALNVKRNSILRALRTELKSKLAGFASADDRATRVSALKQIIVNALQREVYEKTATEFGLNDSDINRINNEFIPDLVLAHADLIAARGFVKDLMDQLNNKWLVTFTYTNHPVEGGPGYSEFRLIGERGIAPPFKLTFNAVASIYHKPDPMKNQERFKGFEGDLAFEYSVTPGYLKDTPDLSSITYSFTGHYERIQENRNIPMKAANIGVAQFKASFPISNGVSIPLSVSYATASDLIKEDHVRGNFGISFDLDKFSALAKLLKR